MQKLVRKHTQGLKWPEKMATLQMLYSKAKWSKLACFWVDWISKVQNIRNDCQTILEFFL